MENEIQVEKVMEQTENRTEDNPSALEPVYYVSRWVQVRTPVKRANLIIEKAGIEARLAEINETLVKIDIEDTQPVAEQEPTPVEPVEQDEAIIP